MKNVKILVGYYKPSVLLETDVLTPIHLGRSLSNSSFESNNWMTEKMIGDNTGDNISHMNKEFCELTALYWAWKNYDELTNPEYIGFIHYRRFYDFHDEKNIVKSIKSFDNEFSLNDYSLVNINKWIQDADLIVPLKSNLFGKTIYDHYFEHHRIEDLDEALRIIKNKCPGEYDEIKKYMQETHVYFLNSFIMKKSRFSNIVNGYSTYFSN